MCALSVVPQSLILVDQKVYLAGNIIDYDTKDLYLSQGQEVQRPHLSRVMWQVYVLTEVKSKMGIPA